MALYFRPLSPVGVYDYVNGVRVKSYADLRTELAKHQVGDEVTLTLLHIERRTRGAFFFAPLPALYQKPDEHSI